MKRFLTPLLIILLSSFTWNSGYEVGDYVDNFKLKNIDGSYFELEAKNSNKGYILIFSCNTCPWVKGYEDRMIELHNKYASKGYPVIAINPNDPQRSPGDSFDNMQKRAKEKDFPFKYLFDETQEVARAYAATNTPQVFLLNKEKGKFKLEYIGAIDNNPRDASAVTVNYVEDALTAIMAGEKVPTTKAKAIGCTIKWKQS